MPKRTAIWARCCAITDSGRRGWSSLRRALEIQPHDEQTLIDAANALKSARAGARVGARSTSGRCEINPRSAEAHNNLGNALLQLGQCAEAVALLPAGTRAQSPTMRRYTAISATRCASSGSCREAITSSQRAIALDPQLSVAHNNLGLALAATRTTRRGRRELPPGAEPQPRLRRGAEQPRQRAARAGRAPRGGRAVPRGPSSSIRERAESHCNLGIVLFEFAAVEEAAASFRRALALQPDYALAHLGLATALRMQGRAAEAEASCRAALAIDPNYVAALSLLGELHADRGQFAEAQELVPAR